MTDVLFPLCAHQLNKLLLEQHVPTGVTALMERPPALRGCSSVTLAHTAALRESVCPSGSEGLPTPRHNVVEGISGSERGRQDQLGRRE